MLSYFNFSLPQISIQNTSRNHRRRNYPQDYRQKIQNANTKVHVIENSSTKHQFLMTMSTPRSSSREHDNNAIIRNDITPIERNGRSNNIPLPLSHKHRTESEMQLSEDMETAEQRDLNMFYRLVNGIRERQMTLVRENESSTAAAAFYDPAHTLTEAERSLAHIIHTRNTPVERKNSSHSTTSFRISTGRRNNFVTNLNSGVPILEAHSDSMQHQQCQQQQDRSDHENEWFVGGFDSSSNLSCEQQQHRQQQQHSSVNYGFATSLNAGSTNAAEPSPLSARPSSNEIADEEGMFDFEL